MVDGIVEVVISFSWVKLERNERGVGWSDVFVGRNEGIEEVKLERKGNGTLFQDLGWVPNDASKKKSKFCKRMLWLSFV